MSKFFIERSTGNIQALTSLLESELLSRHSQDSSFTFLGNSFYIYKDNVGVVIPIDCNAPNGNTVTILVRDYIREPADDLKDLEKSIEAVNAELNGLKFLLDVIFTGGSFEDCKKSSNLMRYSQSLACTYFSECDTGDSIASIINRVNHLHERLDKLNYDANAQREYITKIMNAANIFIAEVKDFVGSSAEVVVINMNK